MNDHWTTEAGGLTRTFVFKDFAEAFAANYGGAGWINKERQRLVDAVARAEEQERGADS